MCEILFGGVAPMPSQQGAFLKFEGHSSVFNPRPEGQVPQSPGPQPIEYHIFQFSSLSRKHSRTLQSRSNFSGSIRGTLDTMGGLGSLTAHTLGISWFRRTLFVHNNSILNHIRLQHCCISLGNPDLLDRGCQNHH